MDSSGYPKIDIAVLPSPLRSRAGREVTFASTGTEEDVAPFRDAFDFEEGNWAGQGRMAFAFRRALRIGASGPYPEDPFSIWVAGLGADRVAELLRLGWCDRRRGGTVKSPVQTPLHFAARNSEVEAAQFLLGHGADPDVADASGQTPLSLAARSGCGELVEALMPASRLRSALPRANLAFAEWALLRRLTSSGHVLPRTRTSKLMVGMKDDVFRLVESFLPVADSSFCEAVVRLVQEGSGQWERARPAFADARFPLD